MRHLVVATHFRRQVITVAAVLLVATLLLMGLTPPQEAHSQEQEKTTQQKSAQEEKAAQSGSQQKATTQNQEKTAQSQEDEKKDKDPKGNEVASGELLVTYKEGASKKAKEEAPKKVNGKVQKDFPEIDVQLVSVPEVKDEQNQEAREQALEQKKEDLEQAPDVEAVDYNHVREGDWVPNDPRYGNQWGYQKINAPGAWDTTRGSSSVKVAVIDSGIDWDHPDLWGKVVGDYDFVDDDDDASAGHIHGTHVAGTIAANTNNNAGVAGTCPNCSLLIARVLDNNNQGSDSDLIAGINWASANGAKVINMSLGGFASSTALQQAIDNAWNRGAVLVASSGNDGNNGTDRFPATYPNVIAVGATDSSDARATWDDPDTTDRVEGSNAGNWVDVAAPGKGIHSTTGGFYWPWTQRYEGRYESWDGTSMAVPHVSGLAGLIFSKGGFMLDNAQVRNRIESTAKDLGTTGRDDVFGHGRINAQAALADPKRELA